MENQGSRARTEEQRYSFDLPGHGVAKGTPGLLRPADQLGALGAVAAKWVAA